MSRRKGTPPTLTKKERKALAGKAGGGGGPQHIHCIACGVHLDAAARGRRQGWAVITCQHGSQFAACEACHADAQRLVDEHDRSGKPVDAAPAFH